jgi:hypothetical protein
MNAEYLIQCFDLTLGIVLLLQLWGTGLYRTYPLFCGFLMAELWGSVSYVLNQVLGFYSDHVYFLTWSILKPVVWLFTLLMIYRLLEKMLVQLSGLRRLSRWVLPVVFLLALGVGFISAQYEYSAPGFAVILKAKQFMVQCWITELVLDRVGTSTALLCLLTMTAFLLWYPVRIPRNLAVFSVGLAVYFTAVTVLLLTRSFWPNATVPIFEEVLKSVNALLGGVSGICYAFWAFFLSTAGDVAPPEPE